jgi:pimeloyl-ACP methyl ester carboxylesterase
LGWFVRAATPEPDVDHIRRWGLNLLSRATPEAAERLVTMPDLPPLDWPRALRSLDLPTLLVHGDQDPFCSLAGMQECARLLPKARLEVLAGVGHVPAMTRPDETASLIRTFLDQVQGD